MTTMTSQIEAMIEAEVARRTTEAVAVLSAKREECDRLIAKLTTVVSDSASVSSADSVTLSTVTVTHPIVGSSQSQLEWLFNKLRPRNAGVVWALLRAAYNDAPHRFELSDGHISYGEEELHRTIFYKCPVRKTDGTNSSFVIKLHAYYNEPTVGRQIFTRVTALSLIETTTPQTVAVFV